nr:MAG: capsid protein [Cressdnaviricota sp.]
MYKMPFKKKVKSRRVRRVHKKPESFSKKVLAVVKKTEQLKYAATAYQLSLTSDFWTLDQLMDVPAQNVTAYSNDAATPDSTGRIGNTFYVEKYEFRWSAYIPPNASASAMLRMVIFQWMVDSYSEAPNADDVFVYNGSFAAPLSPVNLVEERAKKFRIIRDKTYVLVPGGSNGYIHHEYKNLRLPIRRLQVVGNSEVGTSANFIKGKLYVYWCCDESSVEINWTDQLTFSD